MASAEREPITGVSGGAPNGVQGQRPWSGVSGRSPLKLKTFKTYYAQRRAKIWSILTDFSIVFKVVQ